MAQREKMKIAGRGTTRRQFIARAGGTLAGVGLFGFSGDLFGLLPGGGMPKAFAGEELPGKVNFPGIVTETGGASPVYLAEQGSTDPVVHSLADNLFWNEIMMEHALFFTLLMPGDEHADVRNQAAQFQAQFAAHLAAIRANGMTAENYQAINEQTIALVRPFADYKVATMEAQLNGSIHTLVWPLFFAHTAREAKRFIARLEMYNQGQVVFERGEVVEFWTFTMGEHAQFISHLLDPQETELIAKADATAEAFLGALQASPEDTSALLDAGEEIIDFKTAAEQGIATGEIKSIIHPKLADHVRREAVKYVDELKRS